MDYPTITARVELPLSVAEEMAARRRAAGVSEQEADEERRNCGINKSLQDIFRSGVDVTAYGVPVAHWTRGTRR